MRGSEGEGAAEMVIYAFYLIVDGAAIIPMESNLTYYTIHI